MDLAYDHIASESYSDRAATPTPSTTQADAASTSDSEAPASPARPTLQSEFQETFRAFQSSPWASKLGGFWNTARKQGESYYADARREAEAASSEAVKGFSDLKEQLVKRTRSLSVGEETPQTQTQTGTEPAETVEGDTNESDEDKKLRENETFIARFKSEAAKRLKDIERAEDAADEALLRFGTNIRNFLRDAVAVAPPESQTTKEVLFESKDSSGKRVIHASRLDAHLHIIHTTSSGFTEDPSGSGEQWDQFKDNFKIDEKTDEIAKVLDRYPDLRRMMEGLVPEKVEYAVFWCRYYFLRHVVEMQEVRRMELLKASSDDTEEVAWDEDSDEEDNTPSTPQIKVPKTTANTSSTTLQHIPPLPVNNENLKPEGRRSHDEKSVADSDASYDLVSGATSRAPGSPKEAPAKASTKADDSDEDWE